MTEVLRLYLVVTAVAAAVLIVVLNHPKRNRLSFGHIMTRAGTGLLLLSVAYATVESQLMGVPGAPRLWVLAVGLTWLNVGCVATLLERRRMKQRKGSG